ncbi:MAG: hypothetical protein ABFS46_12685 [Myxococcota bacterium]
MASISETLRAAHPDAPWLWREDWAAGRVSSAHGAQALVIWVIAVVFSGFSVPLVLQAPEAAKADGFGVWLFAALFPLASVGLLYWAAQSTLRWRRFRNLSFELSTIPGVVGGRLEGVAHLGRTIQPQSGFTLRLSCLRRRRRARKTEEETIWQEEIVVPSMRAARGPLGSAVPVGFEVPFEAEPSSADPMRLPSVQWRLEILADLPGADLYGFFEVPVFKTDQSSETITERLHVDGDEPSEDPAPASPLHDSLSTGIQDESIRVTPLSGPGNPVEIHLPAGRNRAGALALTLFTGLWNGFILWVSGEVPGLFKLALAPFGLVGMLLAVFVPAAWLQATTLRAERGRLSIHRRMLGMGSPKTIDAREIDSFAPEAKGGNSGKAAFSVRLRQPGRKPKLLVSDLRSKADAEAIAHLLWRGVQRDD